MDLSEMWGEIFETVQTVTRSARSLEEGLALTITAARRDPQLYDDQKYWDWVESHAPVLPVSAIVNWAKEGYEELAQAEGWSFVLVDFGDCPEILRMEQYAHKAFDERRLREMIFAESLFEFFYLAECLVDNKPEEIQALYSYHEPTLTDHNVRELNDEILTWNDDPEFDYNRNNGDLLWLALGCLALIEPLRDAAYCRKILRGRDRLYVLAGYEEIFLYLATVTPDGLQFEDR